MPGTDLTPVRRARLVRDLTIAGWLLLGGPVGFILFQLERVRGVSEQPFGGIWDQRIEVLSFLMLPPNLVVLAPSAFVAATACWLAGHDRETWLNTLVRLVAGIAITMVFIGAVAIVSILLRDEDGPSDIEGVFLRLGGMSLAAGLAVLCRSADRSTGSADQSADQP